MKYTASPTPINPQKNKERERVGERNVELFVRVNFSKTSADLQYQTEIRK